jgi:hypothetical protein
MTTWEARRLGSWFRGVIDGTLMPVPFDGTDDGGLLVFTEPNLAFSLEARSERHVVVRVHFSLESRPPWLGPGEPDAFAYYLAVPISIDVVSRAAADWDRQLEPYPER